MKAKKKSQTEARTRLHFPYKVDYNDHFETPLIAYQDILPLLDAVTPAQNSTYNELFSRKDEPYNDEKELLDTKNRKNKKKEKGNEVAKSSQTVTTTSSTTATNRSNHILYDPYYCNGRAKSLLQSLGFTKIQHEKRDFYMDIQNETVPAYHTLVTNPPYSGTHKERCVQYAVGCLRHYAKEETKEEEKTNGEKVEYDDGCGANKAFFLLMPNYIACREHFRNAIRSRNRPTTSTLIQSKNSASTTDDDDAMDIYYVLPSQPYEYNHPEGTGKETSPFTSIWYCGIPRDKINFAKDAFRQAYGDDCVGAQTPKSTNTKHDKPRLVSTLEELKQLGMIPTIKRRNPKARRKEKLRRQKQVAGIGPRAIDNQRELSNRKEHTEADKNTTSTQPTNKKRSKHRDENGRRKKRRF